MGRYFVTNAMTRAIEVQAENPRQAAQKFLLDNPESSRVYVESEMDRDESLASRENKAWAYFSKDELAKEG